MSVLVARAAAFGLGSQGTGQAASSTVPIIFGVAAASKDQVVAAETV